MTLSVLLLYLLPQGILELDFVTFNSNVAMSPRDHKALVHEIRGQGSDNDRMGLLKIVVCGTTASDIFLTW